jgi:pyridoxamine 5'-phosphate oxidase
VASDQNLKKLISELRHDFSLEMLEKDSARKDPFEQFELWMTEAVAKDLPDPNAMVLSTADDTGRPSSRVVLLRGFNQGGFTFFTNYDSRKAGEIAGNPQAALLFFWADLSKQVRIEGSIAKAPPEVSDSYFASRPRSSQLGAIASPQSHVIADRHELEEKYAALKTEYGDKEVSRPENWGGYIVAPDLFEFWQGRASRLHDRLRYTRSGDTWNIERLAP